MSNFLLVCKKHWNSALNFHQDTQSIIYVRIYPFIDETFTRVSIAMFKHRTKINHEIKYLFFASSTSVRSELTRKKLSICFSEASCYSFLSLFWHFYVLFNFLLVFFLEISKREKEKANVGGLCAAFYILVKIFRSSLFILFFFLSISISLGDVKNVMHKNRYWERLWQFVR